MKNAATAIESYATDTGGDYSGVDGANESSLALVGQGFRHGSLVAVAVQSTPSTYCIRGFHNLLTDEFVYAELRRRGQASGRSAPFPAELCFREPLSDVDKHVAETWRGP